MNFLSKEMSRLKRIPGRARGDVRLIQLLANWREALSAEFTGAKLNKLRLRNGVVLNAPDTLSLAFLFHEIWIHQIYTPPGYEIRRADIVIDVGANIGVFAAYAAISAPDVKVYAYEPFPGNIEWLRKNVEESGLTNVHVYPLAIAGAHGERSLHVNPESWIVHSLVREDGDGREDIKVNCVSLDEVLQDNGLERCDLLKLDCEGSEYEILMQCSPEALSRVKRIVGEYHDGSKMGTGKELCRFLEARSFRIDRFAPMDESCGVLCATNTAA